MQINPGGRLDIKDIIGRDNEIARYWSVLQRQGLVISAERRIGKTHILLKMRDECPSHYLPVYQDLEAVHSIADLIRSIYSTVQKHYSTSSRLKAFIAKWSGLIPRKIGNVDLPAAETAWKVLLADVFDDLVKIADDRTVLMLWDEFPLMLHSLQHREGDDAAMQLLDFLRALRLERAGHLRFLFTGSIGLHLVLRSLRKAGNTNDPVNDMLSLTVPPMSHVDTCALAAALLSETRADPTRISDLALQIADQVGGFPYYVHHVVDQLNQSLRSPQIQDVSSAVDRLIYDSQDPANLEHYLVRLSSYYADDERSLALLVLDTMASQSSPATLPALLNLCKHREPTLGDEQIRQTLTILTEDHYIELRNRAGGAVYEFRWPLVKKWWRERRL